MAKKKSYLVSVAIPSTGMDYLLLVKGESGKEARKKVSKVYKKGHITNSVICKKEKGGFYCVLMGTKVQMDTLKTSGDTIQATETKDDYKTTTLKDL